jgi:hypothetical protein
MAKSINTYIPDSSELEVSISAADVAAMAAFTTEEAVNIDGAMRKLEETTPKTRPHTETYVAGDNTPILTLTTHQSASQWTATLVDDYSLGLAGEWGTDDLAAYEIFWEFFNAARTITSILFTPAGSTTGMIQTTLTNVEVKTMPHPSLDADSAAPAEAEVILLVESYTKAAHA